MNDPFVVAISDIAPDELNTNRHTQAGLQMVEDSLREVRAGRSIVVDKHLKLIGGASVTERAAALGYDQVLVVPTDGSMLIAVQRTDLDMDDDPDQRAHRLAQYDNRAALTNYDLDVGKLVQLAQQGLPLQGLYSDGEISAIMRQVQKDQRPGYEHSVDAGDAPIVGGKNATAPRPSVDRLAFPLAIVLGRADYNRWEAYKTAHDLKLDGAALLELLTFYEEHHEPE